MKLQFFAVLPLLLFPFLNMPALAQTSLQSSLPAPDRANDHYVGNRAPLLASPLIKLPPGVVKPRGWLRVQLELQADGYTGHLPELSEFVKKKGNSWLSSTGEGKHGWEEVPYWLKGFANLGYVLHDQKIIDEAQTWIDAAIASQKEEGWFGPDKGRKGICSITTGRDDLWPNMIMLFVLQSYYEFSEDPRVLRLMQEYFRWQMRVPDDKFLPPFWQQQRAADNLYSVYWLYNRTGDQWLLELSRKIQRNMANWTEDVANWHNVNIAQAFGGPATYYQQSKDPIHLNAAERNWQKVRKLYGQVPGGMFGGDENCRPGYNGPRQAIESCGVVEEMLSDETLLQITGNPIWADRCENVTFNTLPATTTPDLKALRYLVAPNMVLSDRHNKSPGLQNGGPMLHMDPYGHRCCQHNTGHGWPYFVQHLWMATPGNGLAAVIYSPCEVSAAVGNGTVVTITEETGYPFEQRVDFHLKSAATVEFPLSLRIPDWCTDATVMLNGKTIDHGCQPCSFVTINRTWSDGDIVTLELPREVRVTRWSENRNSASVQYGPLTFSLRIGENYIRAGGTDRWPAWEIHPTTPWNYGLVLDADDPAHSFEVVQHPVPAGQPFDVNSAPIQIRAQGQKIPNWKLDDLGLVGPIETSPVRSSEPIEQITLIPMGCARLRLSAFPVIGHGPDAKEWPKSPADLPGPSASHCCVGDSIRAMDDGILPSSSNDQSVARMTWWPLTGSRQWVQYRFEEPRRISGVELYWFDDTGVGKCRVPKKWSIQYEQDDKWHPVQIDSALGTALDQFNFVRFEPIQASAIRLQVDLEQGFSGGVLEWRLLPKE